MMVSKKRKAADRRRRKPARGRGRTGRARRLKRLAAAAAVMAVVAAAVSLYLYVEVTSRFESRLWALPSGIYSSSLTLTAGSPVDAGYLSRRLDRCGYARTGDDPDRPGQYRLKGGLLEVSLRPFRSPAAEPGIRWRSLRIVNRRLAEILDRAGDRRDRVMFEPELLASLQGPRREDRQILMIEDVPPVFLKAILAAEDSRFFSHSGVDFRAVVRAALANVRQGKIVQGGSTITQQTVKNLYLGNQRTWWRKLRELPMALILDLRYEKERILEVYLNQVYLGQRGTEAVCGFQAAARFYFGRDLDDLSHSEQAVLAGLIRSPGRYNPFRHPEAALARRDQVLDAMVQRGWLTDEERRLASLEPLQLASGEKGFGKGRYLVDFVRADLSSFYDDQVLQEEGLKIFTTLDTQLQERAEEVLRTRLAALERSVPLLARNASRQPLQGAVLFSRPLTGAVLAMVGGRDYQDTQFNRTTQSRRQPGSCFKPFVYLAGFEKAINGGEGLTPGAVLDDAPITLISAGKSWSPMNYDREFRGPVTVRQALTDSINIPAVRAGEAAGFPQVIDLAGRCGISSPMQPWPSLALGTQEVSVLELATAYGTIANGGLRSEPRIIEEVWNAADEPLQSREVELHRAVSSRAAFLMNKILQGVLDHGTARSSRKLGYRGNAAGKTGTTDDTRDAWFVGYTPDLLGVVWVGYDDNRRTGLTGATGALPIWVDIVSTAGARNREAEFRRPSGIVKRRIDPLSGQLAVRACPRRLEELYASGTEPDSDCELHSRERRGWFKGLFRRKKNADD
ncbi:MAG: PBP1A family penicillin-binding protein [Acidobacteria bacterium]|uniref:PBP1A family penicillin-binding protein n=1 Tax=Candidatus Polarisedimenticola svalbardensis TaxID=2886004 RepID=A0A8J6Y6M2_9BACT|nr:PBP1A family penicillin-binding protein [Candidatus Polarisedimenticola svalbardensis]